MAKSSNLSPRLWTFRVRGPESFWGMVEGNPPIDHPGGDSVHPLVLTPAEARLVAIQIERQGLIVEWWEAGAPTDDQKEEQQKLISQQDRAWPSIDCPECPWFDPLQKGFPCGLVSWPLESEETLLETSKKHIEAKVKCTVVRPERGA